MSITDTGTSRRTRTTIAIPARTTVRHHCFHDHSGDSSWELGDHFESGSPTIVYLDGTPDDLRALANALNSAADEREADLAGKRDAACTGFTYAINPAGTNLTASSSGEVIVLAVTADGRERVEWMTERSSPFNSPCSR